MSKSAYERIAQGLHEAIALSQGQIIAAKTHTLTPVDVAELRRTLGLSREEFAAKFCVSVTTLRHWECGNRTPHGPALALLHVFAKEPQAVLRALS